MIDFNDVKTSIRDVLSGHQLYYVNYDDMFSPEDMQKAIDSGIESLSDVYDRYDIEETLFELKTKVREMLSDDYSYDEEEIDEFMESFNDEIEEIIFDTCSNDLVQELLDNTSSLNVIYTLGYIDDIPDSALFSEEYGIKSKEDIENFEENYGEQAVLVLRTGFLLGVDISTLYDAVINHYEDNENLLCGDLIKLVADDYYDEPLVVAANMSGNELMENLRVLKDGKRVYLSGGEIGFMSEENGSGAMFEVDIPNNFIFSRKRLYIDDCFGRIPYYRNTVGGACATGDFYYY